MWKKIIKDVVKTASPLANIAISKISEKVEENENIRRETESKIRNEMRSCRTIQDFARLFEYFSNNYDMFSQFQIDNVKLNKICREHNLPKGTSIYYYRQYEEDWTFAVSEIGISFLIPMEKEVEEDGATYIVTQPDTIVVEWKEIKEVEYDSEDDAFVVDDGTENPYVVGKYNLIKNSDYPGLFAEILTRIASLFEDEEKKIFDTIQNMMSENDSSLEDYCNEVLGYNLSDATKAYVYYARASYYVDQSMCVEDDEGAATLNKALELINKSLGLVEVNRALFLKAIICFLLDTPYEARNLHIKLMDLEEEQEEVKSNYGWYCEATTALMNQYNFSEDEYNVALEKIENNVDMTSYEKEQSKKEIKNRLDYTFTSAVDLSKRQFIMFVKDSKSMIGAYDPEGYIQNVFSLDAYPNDIVFPAGHPQANTLYMVHPMLSSHYLPCENIEEVLFLDKVRDFCYVAQCLGATKINFKAIKGSRLSIDKESQLDVSANVGRKLVSVGTDVSKNAKDHYDCTKNAGREWEYTFNPLEKPYCPTDSIWLKSDTSWQQMVKMRLQGNQLSFTERITSSETINMSSNHQQGIEGSFSTILWKISGKVGEKKDETIFKSEENEYEINVIFRSLDDYKENISDNKIDSANPNVENSVKLSSNEEMYKEEILFCLEDDGIIDSDERKLLERKRVRFGISEERAIEIEQMCVPSYTEEEKEYIEIYQELCADGEITERKRRMLERERQSLGISEKRAKELEAKK
jgi:hypothetical protein